MRIKNGLYQVSTPCATGGIIIKNHKIIRCAPYFDQLKKWKKPQIIDFFEFYSPVFVPPLQPREL